MRHAVSKSRSAGGFRRQASKTHKLNVAQVRRGGIRL